MDRIIEVKPSRPDAPTPGFTPGPWITEKAGSGGTLAIRVKVDAHHWMNVAEAFEPLTETVEEQVANARLIAAAPEGYHAVVGLLNAIHDSMTHESQRFHADAIDAARAYLAKAGGK